MGEVSRFPKKPVKLRIILSKSCQPEGEWIESALWWLWGQQVGRKGGAGSEGPCPEPERILAQGAPSRSLASHPAPATASVGVRVLGRESESPPVAQMSRQAPGHHCPACEEGDGEAP